MLAETQEQASHIAELMENIVADNSVPRNIRKIVEEAKNKILSQEEFDTKITSAIYLLDDISNDINMPSHTRTELWTLISKLEAIRGNKKEVVP
ncbi:MAG: UPF0147 family protein [Candidatus Diapherotrites archaeon]|nr:UPF0147 family protein [Candidatus Diapherotrites archaeon]